MKISQIGRGGTPKIQVQTPHKSGGVFFQNTKAPAGLTIATTYLEGNHKRTKSHIQTNEKWGNRQTVELDW